MFEDRMLTINNIIQKGRGGRLRQPYARVAFQVEVLAVMTRRLRGLRNLTLPNVK